MTTSSPWRPALALLLCVGALLAGCSGDDDASDDSEVTDAGADGAAGEDAAGADGADEDAGPTSAWPEPGSWGPNAGPGVPAVTYTAEELYENCAFVSGGEGDITQHHNLVTMYDGYMLMPWAPESGFSGGLSFFDLSDPCQPKQVGYGFTDIMRESHSIGFFHHSAPADGSDDGTGAKPGAWAVVNHQEMLFEGGALFWDISDIAEPKVVGSIKLPGFLYPDAYARVVLSVFWQGPWVFVAGADNGIYVVDARDPTDPKLVTQYTFDPVFRTGQVQAVGNLLLIGSAEEARAAVLDISDPTDPKPIPGGDYVVVDSDGTPRKHYFSNVRDGYMWFARKDKGAGIIIMDVRDPTKPTYLSQVDTDGNGAYVFMHEDYAFTGESRHAVVFDISDIHDIKEITRLNLEGDLDTITPLGHLAVLSVDDKADKENAAGTAITPYLQEPDTNPPEVTWVWPNDGAQEQRTTSRVGVTFNEFVDVKSCFDGSVRMWKTGEDPDATKVDGWVSAQEVIVNFTPKQPLEPNTSYTFHIPAGGVTDFSGNAIELPFTATFTTGVE